ncbi:MAG: hypothetical protein WD555_03885 [Fulvivirga sp.]
MPSKIKSILLYNLTNLIQTKRRLNYAFNLGVFFSTPLLIFLSISVYGLFISLTTIALLNLSILIIVIIIYYILLSLIRKGNMIAIILLSIIISGTIIPTLILVFNEGFESNEDLVINIIVTIIIFFICIFPLYKSIKAVLKYSDEIKEVKNVKKGISHLSYKGKELFRVLKALLLHILAVLFFIFSFVAWIIGFMLWKGGFPIAVPIGLALLGFGNLYGRKILSLSKRNITDTISDIRKKDNRIPILLIRSFQDDNLKIEQGSFKISSLFSPIFTLEETIVNALSNFGPVIAIGNPKERLSPIGAARELYDDDKWLSKIEDYMVESRIIVAILNNTKGLEYEFKRIFKLGLLDKLILIVPDLNQNDAPERWSRFLGLFNLDYNKYINVVNKDIILLKFDSQDIQFGVMCKDKSDDTYYFSLNKVLLNI